MRSATANSVLNSELEQPSDSTTAVAMQRSD
jgi:hypothetical protein